MAYHYGWTDCYIDSLPQSVFVKYYQAITHIDAEKLAVLSRISLLGHSKKASVDKWMTYLNGLKFKSKSTHKFTVLDLAVNISKGVQDG